MLYVDAVQLREFGLVVRLDLCSDGEQPAPLAHHAQYLGGDLARAAARRRLLVVVGIISGTRSAQERPQRAARDRPDHQSGSREGCRSDENLGHRYLMSKGGLSHTLAIIAGVSSTRSAGGAPCAGTGSTTTGAPSTP